MNGRKFDEMKGKRRRKRGRRRDKERKKREERVKKVELQGEKKGKDEQIVNLDEFSFLRSSLHSIVLLSSLLLLSSPFPSLSLSLLSSHFSLI